VNYKGPEIVYKIKSGDRSAFESLYCSFYPKLRYFADQYLLDTEAANSIVQDVFTELWERKKNFQDNTNIQAWLFTVTKNKSLKHLSKERSKQRYNDYLRTREMEVNYKSLSGFDTSNFVFEELQQRIDKALAKLSLPVRTAFEKSRYEDKKNREIAEELGISIKTVEAHISKALKHLREELKDYLPLLCILFSEIILPFSLG
jgi:RNA polymerase sigma-70 factor, ECF subfamily